jgi:hypothetical protein
MWSIANIASSQLRAIELALGITNIWFWFLCFGAHVVPYIERFVHNFRFSMVNPALSALGWLFPCNWQLAILFNSCLLNLYFSVLSLSFFFSLLSISTLMTAQDLDVLRQ